MNNRLELHEEFCIMLGSRNVYFQPPESTKIAYPCIVYHLQDINSIHADDRNYRLIDSYNVMYICREPDKNFVKSFLNKFSLCRFDRWFASDNLNHYVFDLYF